jgi:DNA repair photolyase
MLRVVSNPPNPWVSTHVEWIGEPPEADLEVFEEHARSIIAHNDSPDVGFSYSVNPYRGCYHGCAYCYARNTHELLGFGAGTDFERKIVVKVNAPELLRKELMRPSWKGDLIAFSGVTDCYQPLEASYRLTRGCLEVCADFRQPVAIITKSALVRRDVDLLARLAREARASVGLSIPFADNDTARRMEPAASPPSQRFETLRILADAGVPVGVAVAPLIPGLNDSDIPEILERAYAAGARRAFRIALRLSAEVRPVFIERLRAVFPERAGKVLHAVEEMRGGKMNETAFGARMRGLGPRWEAIEALFDTHLRRLGFDVGPGHDGPTTFRRPSAQGLLFE